MIIPNVWGKKTKPPTSDLFENCSNTMDERSCACGLPLSGEAAGLRTSYSKLSTRSTKHVPTIRETEPTTDPMNLISNRVHCLLMVSLFRPLTFHPVANRWQHHRLDVCGWRAVSGTIKTHGSAKHFGCLILPYSIPWWNLAGHTTIPIYAVFVHFILADLDLKKSIKWKGKHLQNQLAFIDASCEKQYVFSTFLFAANLRTLANCQCLPTNNSAESAGAEGGTWHWHAKIAWQDPASGFCAFVGHVYCMLWLRKTNA